MPGADFYQGLELAEAIRKMAEHHYEAVNRHISAYEYHLLLRTADHLDRGLGARPRSA